MTQAKYTDGPVTFYAGEELAAHRRVKLETGSVTTPLEVVYADAGEDFIGITLDNAEDGDLITVQPLCKDGTFMVEANEAFATMADLYGAANGRVADTSSGTAYFKALEAATAQGDIVEAILHPSVSTTAANVSIADSGAFTNEATVEASLQEIYQHLLTAQGFINIPLFLLIEGDATNTVAALGPSTTPTLDMANGDTDSGLVVTWTNTNTDPVLFQTALPPDLDDGSDLVIHLRAKMGGANDTPAINADSYFNEGDTKVEDATSALGASYAEKTITIGASDIPSGAQTLTVELTPAAHGTDDLLMSAIWIEYQKSLLSS